VTKQAKPKTPQCPDCGTVSVRNGTRGKRKIPRYKCKNDDCGRRFSYLTKKKQRDAPKPQVPTKASLREDTHVFLFTWGQNATQVHEGFWAALNALKDRRDADLNVIKGRYSNPTRLGENRDDEWWVEDIMPYLWDKRSDVCPALTVLGNIRVRPTAKRPLTGKDSITGGKSGILGHPKLEMRVVPTPQNSLPKQMLTTGACTVANYSDSGAGAEGDFHHTIGATIVEVRGDKFHMRSINALRDGSFIDIDTEYLPDGTHRPAERALALCMGDWHSGFTCPEVIEATFGLSDSTGHDMCSVLKPAEIFWDDLLDQYGRNHHHRFKPFVNIAKAKDQYYSRGNLMYEVESALMEVQFYTDEAEARSGLSVKSVVKASNHDEALDRYIEDRNWKSDPQNAEFYLDTALRITKATTMEYSGAQYPSALHVWAKEFIPDVTMLGRRGSYVVADIECIYHGDVGLNGARGSILAFSKIGVKTNIAHSHTPGIVGGCHQAGTSTVLDLEYAKGPSSWMNTHIVIYANGKRVLLTVIDGEWRHE